MAKLAWSLACRRAIVDESTRLATIVDVLEGFEFVAPASKMPDALPFEMSIVCLWARTDPDTPEESGIQRVRLVGPDSSKKNPDPWEGPINLHTARYHRNILNFQGLPYLGEGDYVFHIESKDGERWKAHSEVVVQVRKRLKALNE